MLSGVAVDLNTPELETLARYLDTYREVVVWKLDGLDEEAARRTLVPSGTSLLNIVQHLGYAERYWFQRVLAGRDVELPWEDGDDIDADWRVDPEATIADVVAFYDGEIGESRRILADFDDPGALVPRGDEDISVRRVLVHMVEETARHAGHADIIRELIDGSAGNNDRNLPEQTEEQWSAYRSRLERAAEQAAATAS
jgi:uncharacterized damage-inducible protein DinB